jgi:hypothetical protein
LAPFDIASLDSAVMTSDGAMQTFSEKFFVVVKAQLYHSGAVRDVAAYCCATYYTRPDMEKSNLQKFIGWLISILQINNQEQSISDYVSQLGALSALVQIFKRGDRLKLLEFVPSVLLVLFPLAKTTQRSLERKFLCKAIQRVGLVLLLPREAPWRYQRGLRSLQTGLITTEIESELLVEQSAEMEINEDEVSDEQFIPTEIEEILDI